MASSIALHCLNPFWEISTGKLPWQVPSTQDYVHLSRTKSSGCSKNSAFIHACVSLYKYNAQLVGELRDLSTGQFTQTSNAYFLPIAPAKAGGDKDDWKKFGQAVMQCADTGKLTPMIKSYASLGDAFRAGTATSFRKLTDSHIEHLRNKHPDILSKTSKESLFNQLKPFSKCIVLYIVAFLSICAFWLLGRTAFRDAAFSLLMCTIVVHGGALATRMWLENRPPVTNLYSSAVFVGFGAVVLGAILEKCYRNGIGTVAASLIGFLTLLIAHALSLNGDTLEMMRAVLDSNFWLATHVVVISLGYAATFLAGALAIAHIMLNLVSRKPIGKTGNTIPGMVYGIICFATLFSFVGTILGGIWADQSWGRFWGWDPKENGALLIVLWNAVILHARWGGIIHQRGLMVMAVFGNIVTSWSWFGTNMLGIGLHFYGFTTAAFQWLLIFIISQLIIMIIGGFCLKKPRHGIPEITG
jgi:ABC-type transport system involved in cytochrome c biogenesis permease subunit